MIEMRRNLQFEAEQARHQPSPMAELRKLEMQARLDFQRELRRMPQSWSVVPSWGGYGEGAVKREAENKERLAWLEELQRDYNVDGSAPRAFNIDSRKKRAFLTPEVRAGQGP